MAKRKEGIDAAKSLVTTGVIREAGGLVDPALLQQLLNILRAAGQAANRFTAENVFESHRKRKAQNTLRRQAAELRDFEDYLRLIIEQTGTYLELPLNALANDPSVWAGVTHGLVETYLNWCLAEGYAIPSINLRLSTIRVYARLAAKAGYLPGEEIRDINALRAYGFGEAKRVNEKRSQQRVGKKKAEPTLITDELTEALIDQRPDTAQGRRDQLLMCVLLHHGLRVSEARLLTAESFDLQNGTFTFYRPKVHKTQTHRMTKATLAAAKAFLFGAEAPRSGPIFSESNKNGTLDKNKRGNVAISERGLNKRVEALGKAVGLENLSPHDCRHYWATNAARRNTPLDRLKQAGGWNSVAMPMRYIAEAEIANEGLDPNEEGTETTGGSKQKRR